MTIFIIAILLVAFELTSVITWGIDVVVYWYLVELSILLIKVTPRNEVRHRDMLNRASCND